MNVTLGNRFPLTVKPEDRRGDHVTYASVPDEFEDDAGVKHWDIPDPKDFDHAKVRKHFQSIDARQGITRMADVTGSNCEGLLPFIHPRQGIVTPYQSIGHFGMSADGNNSAPTFVDTPHDGLNAILSEWYQCPVGLPSDLEDTHTTRFGPPGVGAWANPVDALFTNVGRVAFNNMMGGGQVGSNGTGTAASSNTFTTASTFTTNQWAGWQVAVYGGAPMVWGNIISNTNAASAGVLTIDRWYNPATPGGSAGTTPAGSYFWIIFTPSNSFWFMGLTATATAPAAGDTALTGEITTGGGGLIRKISAFAQTSGTSPTQYTLTAVYTANGSDSLPVTLAAIGIFNSMVVGDTTNTLMWHTLYSTTATLSSSGDQLTSVDTVTGS